MRTRVCKTRRNKDKWEWYIFDGDWGSDHGGPFDSEAEARADLAKAIPPHQDAVQRDEDSATFMADAFYETGGSR